MKANLLYRGPGGRAWLRLDGVRAAGGSETVTLVIGLTVHKNWDRPRPSFYITGQRMGIDFGLLSADSRPLTAKQLTAVLGPRRALRRQEGRVPGSRGRAAVRPRPPAVHPAARPADRPAPPAAGEGPRSGQGLGHPYRGPEPGRRRPGRAGGAGLREPGRRPEAVRRPGRRRHRGAGLPRPVRRLPARAHPASARSGHRPDDGGGGASRRDRRGRAGGRAVRAGGTACGRDGKLARRPASRRATRACSRSRTGMRTRTTRSWRSGAASSRRSSGTWRSSRPGWPGLGPMSRTWSRRQLASRTGWPRSAARLIGTRANLAETADRAGVTRDGEPADSGEDLRVTAKARAATRRDDIREIRAQLAPGPRRGAGPRRRGDLARHGPATAGDARAVLPRRR